MARPNIEQYDDYEEYHRPNKGERKHQQKRSRRDTKNYLKDWACDDYDEYPHEDMEIKETEDE